MPAKQAESHVLMACGKIPYPPDGGKYRNL